MPYAWVVPLLLFYLLRPPAVGAAAREPQAATEAHPNPQELVREVVESGLRLKAKDKDQIHWSYREVIRKD